MLSGKMQADKHLSFKQEKEWRLILQDELTKDNNEWVDWYNLSDTMKEEYTREHPIFSLFPHGIEFRTTEDNVISYMDLNFESVIDEIISEIWIGPKRTFHIQTKKAMSVKDMRRVRRNTGAPSSTSPPVSQRSRLV